LTTNLQNCTPNERKWKLSKISGKCVYNRCNKVAYWRHEHEDAAAW